jgi:GNAT superfamily N-acetyltransferase
MRPSDRLRILSGSPSGCGESDKTAAPRIADFARGDAVREFLRDGRQVEIRALRPDDRAELLAAIGRVSAESLYRRFFGVKRNFTDKEIVFFLNVDFVNHVALVAVIEEGGRPTIVGGGRYVVVRPGTAELAFAVLDQYQGLSIGVVLIRHLIEIARAAGLAHLIADVLPSNTPMLKVFERSGVPFGTRRESESVHVSLILK